MKAGGQQRLGNTGEGNIGEHNCGLSPNTPEADRENRRETTSSISSLDFSPAPETTSPSLAQSEPVTGCPAKSDTKSGLVDSDDLEQTWSKNTKDTVSTSQEDEEEVRVTTRTTFLHSHSGTPSTLSQRYAIGPCG